MPFQETLPLTYFDKAFVMYGEKITNSTLNHNDKYLLDLDDSDSDYSIGDDTDDTDDDTYDPLDDCIPNDEVYNLISDIKNYNTELTQEMIENHKDADLNDNIEIGNDVIYFNNINGNNLPGSYRFDKIENKEYYQDLINYIEKMKINKWRTYFLDNNILLPIHHKNNKYFSVEHFCLVKTIQKTANCKETIICYGGDLPTMTVEQIKKLLEPSITSKLQKSEIYKKLRYKGLFAKSLQHKEFENLLLCTEYAQLMINGVRDLQYEKLRETITI